MKGRNGSDTSVPKIPSLGTGCLPLAWHPLQLELQDFASLTIHHCPAAEGTDLLWFLPAYLPPQFRLSDPVGGRPCGERMEQIFY